MSDPDWSGYSDVLDNREFDVAERANALAPEAETVRIAVGYFYLGGFDLLKENLRGADRVEFLVGTDTDQRTIDELERGFVDDLEQYERSEAQEGINRLYELVQVDKVDVRVYDGGRFRPKGYGCSATEYNRRANEVPLQLTEGRDPSYFDGRKIRYRFLRYRSPRVESTSRDSSQQ